MGYIGGLVEQSRAVIHSLTCQTLSRYDKIIIAFSGGKDSLACLLYLLFNLRVPAHRLELWHHLIDGDGGEGLMDWPCTESYCTAIARHLGVTIRFSWREGGFEREMNRNNTPTAPVVFEDGDGNLRSTTPDQERRLTRLKFPQVGEIKYGRYCSPLMKMDVAKKCFTHDPRFDRGNFLLVSGERREESKNRAGYLELEPHSCFSEARRVYQWRPVIDWTEEQVWEIIQRHSIRPHPAYQLGWGRVSCMLCIFGNPDQWASARRIAPARFAKVAQYERKFGATIHRTQAVEERASKGTPFADVQWSNPVIRVALSTNYNQPIVMNPWVLPSGAYKKSGGPT